MNIANFFLKGLNKTLKLINGANFSYAGPWVKVYPNTIIDSWYVGDFSTATYVLTIEHDSNKKEVMHVNVVARPDQASYTIYGRTSIDDELIILDASVNNSIFTLKASPTDVMFTGVKVTKLAFYGETINPLTQATTASTGPGDTGSAGGNTEGGGTGGTYTLPIAGTGIGGTLGGVKIDGTTITINNGVITAVGGGSMGGSGTVNSGSATSLAYYPSTGSVVDDISNVTWGSNTLSITGAINVSAQKNFIRFHWDTLTDLNNEANPVTWHGMIAHVHATGRVYVAHSGAWTPLALQSDIVTATTSVLGGVKIDGSTITINGSGVITANYTNYSLPTASTTVTGGVKIDGTTLAFNGSGQLYYTGAGVGGYSLPTATTGVLGGVKIDGSTITINGSGVITANYTTYSLPTASTTVTGGIKIDGSTLAFNGSGQLYYTGSGAGGYSLPTATTGVLGGVKIDGSTITINGSGVITANYTTYSLPTATGSVLGGVKVGTGLAIDGAGVLSASASSVTTYPAITILTVTANGSSAYLFDQYSGNNPTIYAISGTTIAFDLGTGALSSHPFLIRLSGANYDTGLVHVSSAGVVTTGSLAQGKTSGTLYWKIPASISGAYGYLCAAHGGMIGTITIKQISSLP